jgi:hypothetical protein
MTEYIKDESVEEEGPWHLYYNNGKVSGIGSHDFTHDVYLGISGDFGYIEEKQKYANEIVRRLNAYGAAVKPSNASYTYEALRMIVDVLEQQADITPEAFEVVKKEAMERARYALICRGEVYEKHKGRVPNIKSDEIDLDDWIKQFSDKE